jgi:hypothetical protein
LVADTSAVLKLVLQLTKGIIRDQKARRIAMFYIMLAALVMLFLGSVFLSDRWAREHVWLFIGYWFVCAWLTLSAMLLAVLDVLIIHAATRAHRRKIEAEFLGKPEDKP